MNVVSHLMRSLFETKEKRRKFFHAQNRKNPQLDEGGVVGGQKRR